MKSREQSRSRAKRAAGSHEMLDELARVLEAVGFPQGIARVYAALTLVEGEGASTSALTEMLEISKASVTGAMQFLTGTGLAERYRVRGSREAHYRIVSGKWGELLEKKFSATSYICDVTKRALEVVESDEARVRLTEMHEIYSFFEKEFVDMMRRWKRRRGG